MTASLLRSITSVKYLCPLPTAHLVDGDLLQILKLGFAETALQVPLLSILDNVPTDTQVKGRVLDRRTLRQFQRVAIDRKTFPRLLQREANLASQVIVSPIVVAANPNELECR